MSSRHDDPFLEHIPSELHDEYRRSQPKPKQRAKPDLDPRPPAEREDNRTKVAEGIYRQGPEQPTEDSTARALQQAHETWVAAGSPEHGWAAENLQSRLADAYLLATPNSDWERHVTEYGVSLGQERLLNEVADTFNQMANRVDVQTRGQEAVKELWTEAKLDPEVREWLQATYENDPEYLAMIAEGQLSADQIKHDLAERRSASEEMILANRRLDTLSAENEEVIRLGPTLDEAWMNQSRAELAQSADEQTDVTEEHVEQRKQRLLGERTAPEPFPISADVEEWRRMGALPDPEAEARRERARAEDAAEERESVDA